MPEREGRSYQGCPEIFCDDLRTLLILGGITYEKHI